MNKYVLVSDDSGHEYVIPAAKLNEWESLDFEEIDDVPDYAKRIGGSFEFENPTAYGKLLFNEYE